MTEQRDTKTIRFGIASTAEIAKNKVIPALKAVDSVTLVGVSSRSKEKAREFVEKHDAGRVMAPHEVMVSSKDVDAVYVPMPSRVRNAYMKRLLLSGKHVYSEKPHGGTVADLKSVLDLAKDKNLQWMDGTMWYHSTRTKVMTKRLRELGRVHRVSASFSWGNGLVDQEWIDGGNGRTDPSRERMGMLGDSGHYPISAVGWAFDWELPLKVQAMHTKKNKLGAIVTCEAFLWFKNGGRAIIDTSCENPHRSQFEIVCEKGVLKVDDLVGGQGRSGNFAAYESPFVGSSSFVVGDQLGKDVVVKCSPCDHVNLLVSEFARSVQHIQSGGRPNPEWSRRALCTHTIMCSIFESAMRDGAIVELHNGGTSYVIGGKTYADIPTKEWL